MFTEIPLRLKYRSAPAGRVGYKPKSDNKSPKKLHRPLTDKEQARVKKQQSVIRVLHLLANGKHRMEIVK